MGLIDVDVGGGSGLHPEVFPDLDLIEEGWEVKLSDTINRKGKKWWLYRNPTKNVLITEWIGQALARYLEGLQVTIPPTSDLADMGKVFARNQKKFAVNATVTGYELIVPNEEEEQYRIVFTFDTYGDLMNLYPHVAGRDA